LIDFHANYVHAMQSVHAASCQVHLRAAIVTIQNCTDHTIFNFGVYH